MLRLAGLFIADKTGARQRNAVRVSDQLTVIEPRRLRRAQGTHHLERIPIAGECIADEKQLFHSGVPPLLRLFQDPQRHLGVRRLLFAGYGRGWQPELVAGRFQPGSWRVIGSRFR